MLIGILLMLSGDIDVDAPYMELYLFSPRKERINYESTFLSSRR